MTMNLWDDVDNVPVTSEYLVVYLRRPDTNVILPVMSYIPQVRKDHLLLREMANMLHSLAWATEDIADEVENNDIRDGKA